MKKTTILGIACAAMFGVIGSANASLLTLSGGTPQVTPAQNDVVGAGVPYLDNADILTTDEVVLSFYYLGSESTFTDTLNVAGDQSYSESGTPAAPVVLAWPGQFLFSIIVGSGVQVPMWFTSTGFAGSLYPAGGDLIKSIAFAYMDCTTGVSCIQTDTPTDIVWFGLDDSGGNIDDNHDDFVGYVRASKVPEPGSLALLGLGLLGLGAARRRVR